MIKKSEPETDGGTTDASDTVRKVWTTVRTTPVFKNGITGALLGIDTALVRLT